MSPVPARLAVVLMLSRPAPAAGTAWWYLVRSRNSCGTGTFGTSTQDQSIPACP